MATSEIRLKPVATKQAITITLASLAAAAGRQSTLITNSSNYPSAIVYVKLESGAAGPTAGKTYEVYLLRGDDAAAMAYSTDAAGANDAAITIENAQLLGTLVLTNTANKNFYGEFDTTPLGPLGPIWGIAIKNASDQALNATEGNHTHVYTYFVPEAQ